MADDDLLTLVQIAALAGVTEQSIRTMHNRAARRRREGVPYGARKGYGAMDMPAPDMRVGRIPTWRRATIMPWIERRNERKVAG